VKRKNTMSTSKMPERVPHEAAFAMISLGILIITLYVIDADVSHTIDRKENERRGYEVMPLESVKYYSSARCGR
jgi:hypothetical protein